MITWLRRRFTASPLIAFYLSIFMVAPQYPAQAAPTYAFSSLSSRGCVTAYSGTPYGSRYVVYRNSSISGLTIQIGTGATTNFGTSKYYIRTDNSGTPGTVLATFSPLNVTAGLARYSGSYSATSGTKFWITPGQTFSTFPGCYGQPLLASDLTNDGSMNVDSTTGLTGVYYTQSSDGTATWGTGVASNFLFQLGIEIGGDTSTVTISSVSPNDSPLIYNKPYTLTATLSTPGKTTFYAMGKTIPGCKNILWATTTATCSWKPAIHGSVAIYATLKPTDSSLSASVSPTLTYGVSKRANTR
jgi:hypothetical protein